MNEELKRQAEYVARHTLDEAAARTIDDLLAELDRAEPLTMSMFASRKDYDAAVTKRAYQMKAEPVAIPEGYALSDVDAAIAVELTRVSHVQYDSHEICKHFAGKVRERLLAAKVQKP